MLVDSEPIKISEKSPDALTSMFGDMIGSIQYKLFGLMFIVFLILSSDMFINRVLSKIDGAVDMKYPTNYGTMLQGMFLAIIMIIIDALIKQKII